MSPDAKTIADRLAGVRARAAEGRPAAPLAALPCALDGASTACGCGGKGFVVSRKGPYLAAAAGSCLAGCPAGAGQARRVVDNVARSCRTPPPPVVINLLNAAQIPAHYADAALDKFKNLTGNGKEFLRGIE